MLPTWLLKRDEISFQVSTTLNLVNAVLKKPMIVHRTVLSGVDCVYLTLAVDNFNIGNCCRGRKYTPRVLHGALIC